LQESIHGWSSFSWKLGGRVQFLLSPAATILEEEAASLGRSLDCTARAEAPSYTKRRFGLFFSSAARAGAGQRWSAPHREGGPADGNSHWLAGAVARLFLIYGDCGGRLRGAGVGVAHPPHRDGAVAARAAQRQAVPVQCEAGSAEEVIQALSPEMREALARQLKANGSAAKEQ
jgi:hypothetical protein